MAPVQQAVVKSVLSGDTLVLTATNNPKAERILSLACVDAPRVKKEGEEPYGFSSRDFLIKHCVGKTIRFQVLYMIPIGANREYGRVMLANGMVFPEASVSEGWVKLREDAGKRLDDSEETRQFFEKLELEQAKARADNKGVWSTDNDGRIEVQQDLPDAKAFVEEHKGQQLHAVVERVLTGDRVILRFLLSPKQHVQAMVLVAGIRAPITKRTNPSDGKEQPGEPFGEEASQFLESRILQRTVAVQAVGTTPQGQLVCSIAHQQGGDMAGHVLRAGLARCVDYHSTMLGGEMAKLRQAEKEAKDKKINLFQGHVATKSTGGDVEVTVTRVLTADTIFVRSRNGAEKKYNFSSIRQPKPTDPKQSPFQAEAKEFLRKKLIGKHVKVSVDGKKPAADGYEEREVATVILGGNNIALQLVEAGWASVIRHRRDDTDRSPSYDELLAAEEVAQKEGKGMWSGKPAAAKQYVDYSESLQKAKIQASVLQRQHKIPAVVDFAKGASRFIILIPRENAKLTLVLSGIRAPRVGRTAGDASDAYGQEALEFANRKCLQRDVEVDIEGTDKVGGFIGTLWVNRENFTKLLVEEGLATVHAYSAENSPNGQELFAAEKRAKEARKNLWIDWDPSQDEEAEDVHTNGTNGDAAATVVRKIDYKEVAITHIDPETLKLKIQIVGTGTGALEDLMSRFRQFHISSSGGLPKDSMPKVGDLVSARFSEDKTWYRARIRRNDKEKKQAHVVYIDYGNEETLPWSELRPLSEQFDVKKLRAQAQDATLSFIEFPQSQQYRDEALEYLNRNLPARDLVANIDYADSKDGMLYVTLFDKDLNIKATESINAEIVAEGCALVARKLRAWEKNGEGASDILATLKQKQKAAESERRGIWEYGDITGDYD